MIKEDVGKLAQFSFGLREQLEGIRSNLYLSSIEEFGYDENVMMELLGEVESALDMLDGHVGYLNDMEFAASLRQTS